MRCLLMLSASLLFTLTACGELEREDHNGAGNDILVPVNVQNIFSDHCAWSGCHGGSSPQKGMNLSQAYAYDAIVNVTSSEQPSLKRIKPGQPDNSYLIRKIEGTAGINGDRMPADGPPYLTSAQIDTIRFWISNGALSR